MNKIRSGARYRLKTSPWDGNSQRKSMSLHDLTEAPTDTFGNITSNQNTSIVTLDSIPKSRDSGLSRSVSRLSLPSISRAIGQSTPRTPTIHDLQFRIDELEDALEEKERALAEKEKDAHHWRNMYKTLFAEHQALELKYAAFQIDVDRMRLELYNKNSPPSQQLIESTMQRSKTHDGFFSQFHLDDNSLRRMSTASGISDSEFSAPEPEEDSASSLNYAATSSGSDEATKDETIRKLYPGETPALPETPTPIRETLELDSSFVANELSSFPRRGSLVSLRREEIVLSPVPSSGKWTLDKSMQLVSDSDLTDMSEPGEEDECNESVSMSVHTEETAVMSHSRSEETLRGTEFDEVALPMSMDDTHVSLLAVPVVSSFSKVESWQNEHWTKITKDIESKQQQNDVSPILVSESKEEERNIDISPGWSVCKKSKPQDLTLNLISPIQRLRSPQNMALLSPRPYSRQGTKVLSHINTSCVVPLLDLSQLHSDGDSHESTAEEHTSSSHQELEHPSSSNSSTSHQAVNNSYIPPSLEDWKQDRFLKIANRNLDRSHNLLNNIKSRYK